MTPAPISVERLAVSHVKPYGLMYPDPRGEFVRHSDYAALLHQLAERDAEVERLRRECDLRKHAVDRWMPCPDHRDKVDGRCQVCAKEAAERAREEAIALLRELRNNTGSEQAYTRVAAFLAASGGKVDG